MRASAASLILRYGRYLIMNGRTTSLCLCFETAPSAGESLMTMKLSSLVWWIQKTGNFKSGGTKLDKN